MASPIPILEHVRAGLAGLAAFEAGPRPQDLTARLRRGEKVALIGRHAIDTVDMGGGSAQVNPPSTETVS